MGYVYSAPFYYAYEAPLHMNLHRPILPKEWTHYKCPFLKPFPVELLAKVPCLKPHAGTLSANSLRHRLRSYISTCILCAPCCIYLFIVPDLCYFFLSLENETGAEFQTQPSQSARRLSSNMAPKGVQFRPISVEIKGRLKAPTTHRGHLDRRPCPFRPTAGRESAHGPT